MSIRKKPISKLLLEILDHYRDKTILEIVEDIHSKIDTPKTIKKGEYINTIKRSSILLREDQIKNLPKFELANFLKQYSKSELLAFCKSINLKLNSKESSELITERIVNHYTFLNLNKRMADRDNSEIPFENNQSDVKPTEII